MLSLDYNHDAMSLTNSELCHWIIVGRRISTYFFK